LKLPFGLDRLDLAVEALHACEDDLHAGVVTFAEQGEVLFVASRFGGEVLLARELLIVALSG